MPIAVGKNPAGSSERIWLDAIAASTVESAGNSTHFSISRSGSTYTTLTRIVSAIRAIGLGAEFVDHAIGQFLESGSHERRDEAAGVFEVERQQYFGTLVAERREFPAAAETLEGPIDQRHVD